MTYMEGRAEAGPLAAGPGGLGRGPGGGAGPRPQQAGPHQRLVNSLSTYNYF